MTHLVAYKGHPAIVAPRKVSHRRAPIVDELDAPPALVLYPHENDARAVASRQFLVGLVPLHHRHLRKEIGVS